jgi:hypothetical protein
VNPRRSWVRLAVAVGFGLALGGCSELAPVTTESSDGPVDFETFYLDRMGVALEDAREELGVSENTYEVYLDAADRDYVLASDLQQVMPEFIACIDDSTTGLEVDYEPETQGIFGLPNVSWSIITPPDRTTTSEEDLLIEDCWRSTIGPLERMFFNQPYSPERNDAWLADGRRDAAWACLEEAGYFVSEDASFQDTLDIAKEMSDDTGDSACLELVLYGETN